MVSSLTRFLPSRLARDVPRARCGQASRAPTALSPVGLQPLGRLFWLASSHRTALKHEWGSLQLPPVGVTFATIRRRTLATHKSLDFRCLPRPGRPRLVKPSGRGDVLYDSKRR
ncbi:hypothetical protein GQ53DRAFT_309192 [Thozetella sp. PMI_491]|nr:hypothetical protein GQ53DRAFT_309192 [Thozetella sp. PMI_491]